MERDVFGDDWMERGVSCGIVSGAAAATSQTEIDGYLSVIVKFQTSLHVSIEFKGIGESTSEFRMELEGTRE